MKELVAKLMETFYNRKAKGTIKEPLVIAIIEKYASKLCESEFTIKTPNSIMILKLLIASGDDMPVDNQYAESFHKAYRQIDVIYTRGMGSYDTVMWNLMHKDDLIWEVLKEEGFD